MFHRAPTVALVLFVYPVFALKLGAFNIQTYGQTKASKPEVMSILGKILSRYDIVLIQEIRDQSGTAIVKLLDEVNSASPHVYSMILSDRLGRTSYKEQYAFFYRSDNGISVLDFYHYDDGDEALGEDTFIREPFVVRFGLDSAGVKEIALIPLHASPEFAVEEIHELVEVHKDVVERWGITNVIILGDLNADCNYVRASDWPNIALRSDKQYDWRTADDEDTTVSTTDCAYDRIVLMGDELIAKTIGAKGEAYRFEDVYELSYQEALAVSDHYPVEIDIPETRQL